MYLVCVFFQRLDERDFGERKEINKRKKLILEGKVCVSVFGPPVLQDSPAPTKKKEGGTPANLRPNDVSTSLRERFCERKNKADLHQYNLGYDIVDQILFERKFV